MKTTRLNSEEAQALSNFLISKVMKVIVLESLTYVETNEFDIESLPHSTFHVFGAYNSYTGQLQKVTFEVETGMISFDLHPIRIS
jgi:hypothetical protein